MLHNLTHDHMLLEVPGRGTFQVCTNKVLKSKVTMSYAPYDHSVFHPVPMTALEEIAEAATPEAIMAIIRREGEAA